jgi:hypothetical protein
LAPGSTGWPMTTLTYSNACTQVSSGDLGATALLVPTEQADMTIASIDATASLPPFIGIGTVVGTDDEGVRCRVQADPDADILFVIPEGAVVGLTGPRQGEWQPVICDGQAGFVHRQFLLLEGESQVSESTTEPASTIQPTVLPEPTESSMVEPTPEPTRAGLPKPTALPVVEPTPEPAPTIPPEPTEQPMVEPTPEPTPVAIGG